jgi:very-short-patch-repair endonuclease
MQSLDTYIFNLQLYYETTGLKPVMSLPIHALGVSTYEIREAFGTWKAALQAAGLARESRTLQLTCDTCNKPFIREFAAVGANRNFCSQRCSGLYTRSRTHTQETKMKQSSSLRAFNKAYPKNRQDGRDSVTKMYTTTCCGCLNTFTSRTPRTTCSEQCYGQIKSQQTSKWLSANRSHVRGSHQQSYLESSFQMWLEAHGLRKSLHGYLTEVHFYNRNTKKHGWADFVFPAQKLIIELDGSQHTKRKQLDDIRDAHLISRGWKVVRITHTEYRTQSRVNEIKILLNLE